MVRKIIFYKKHFINFYVAQNDKIQKKIDYVLKLIGSVDKIPKKFLKHIENSNGLYEIRINYNNNIFRIFCCFDEGNIIILFNAFQKKTRKTPKKEIEKGIKLMKQYYKDKKGGKP